MRAAVESRNRVLLCLTIGGLLLAGWLTVTPGRAGASGQFQLRAAHSGLCVTMDGSAVRQASCVPANTDTNMFVLQPSDDGSHRIVKLGTNRCLAVKDGSLALRAPIIVEGCNGDWRQQWWINDNGATDQYREYVNRRSELCMDVRGALTTPTDIWQYTCHQGDNQRFLFF
jgi:hypothetical protein